MYFDDLRLGMTVNTAPAIIKKEKMLAFAHDYDHIPCTPMKNMQRLPLSAR